MGDLLAFLEALSWSVSGVPVALGAHDKDGDNGAFLSILLTLVLAGLVWAALGFHSGWQTLNARGMAWFALAGGLTIFVGRVFFHSSIQWLGPVRGSSIKRTAPFFSVLLPKREKVTTSVVAAAVLGLLGAGITLTDRRAAAVELSRTSSAPAR